MCTPILAIIGKSGSGKTTLIEKLLKILTARGHTIATIKHDAHRIEIDKKGKDSWRHREAGAAAVALVSSGLLFFTKKLKTPLSLSEVRDAYLADGYDLILAEGFKRDRFEKIAVIRDEDDTSFIDIADETIIAVVTMRPLSTEKPMFATDDAAAVADFIERRFLSKLS
jgi:molybdopterin-guanine dinucleotide biosynthesis protein B